MGRNDPTKGTRSYRRSLEKHPTFHVGDMLENYQEIVDNKGYVLFTANSTLTKNFDLVMGAGIAKQVAQMFPEMPSLAGRAVRDRCNHLGEYGVIVRPEFPVGLFQTKTHWRQRSNVELLKYSLSILSAYAYKTRTYDYHLNYPAIGLGGLDKEIVHPLLMWMLPRNVHIWELEDDTTVSN